MFQFRKVQQNRNSVHGNTAQREKSLVLKYKSENENAR